MSPPRSSRRLRELVATMAVTSDVAAVHLLISASAVALLLLSSRQEALAAAEAALLLDSLPDLVELEDYAGTKAAFWP